MNPTLKAWLKWIAIIIIILVCITKVPVMNQHGQQVGETRGLVVIVKSITNLVMGFFTDLAGDMTIHKPVTVPGYAETPSVNYPTVSTPQPGTPQTFAPIVTSKKSPQLALQEFLNERKPEVSQVVDDNMQDPTTGERVRVRWMVNGVTKNRLKTGGDIDPTTAVPAPAGKKWERVKRDEVDPNGDPVYSYFVRE